MKSFTIVREHFPTKLRDIRGGLLRPLMIQIAMLVFAFGMLDNGLMASIVLLGILPYWLWIIFLVRFRRDALTKTDVVLIRSGYLLFSAAGAVGYFIIAALFEL